MLAAGSESMEAVMNHCFISCRDRGSLGAWWPCCGGTDGTWRGLLELRGHLMISGPCAMVVNQVLNEIHFEVLTIQKNREREKGDNNG